jgi:tape measure domain-containing protein|tara:strand:- start:4246 stop:8409 length:4164 start_codon:yes stop_codon:yes gene_type:complete
MLTIPVKLDLDAGAAEAALKNFERGAKDALQEIVELNGKKVNIDFKFSTSGDPVVKELNDQQAALKRVTDGYNKLTGGQAKSIGRTKKVIQQFKAQRDAAAANSREYREAAEVIKRFESQLRSLQGIQTGSISDIKRQRSELVALRDAASLNSPEFKKLTAEIQKFDKQLAASKPKANSFVTAFAKIAIVSAGIQAVGSALRSVTNTIDAFVRRTKDVEGFSLALRNAGLEQAEVNRVFKQAETTANALGAPLAQVEKTYKRMIPALQAVGTSSADSDKFIEQISARTQTLGLNTEQSGRLLEAFAQVLSKGKLQAEELNQQISELDGAFRVQFAEALGVSTQALNDLISNSKITADVFVQTVNKMANGADLLKKRIKDGTATIQQFQNQIGNIDTKNIEVIGKAIEPAIKSFLQIRLAVAQFIEEFTKSAQFESLVNIFNSIAKGAEQFAAGLIKVIGAIGEFLSPLTRVVDFVLTLDAGIGNLVTLLIKAAGTIAAVTLATKGIVALGAGVAFVKQQFINLSAAITGNGVAANTAGPSMVRYGATVKATGFAAASTAGKIKMIGAAIGKFVVIAGAIAIIDKIIGSFTAAGKAAEKMNTRFSDIKLDFKDKLEELNKEVEKTPDTLSGMGDALEHVTDKTEAAGEANKFWGTTLGTVAIAAGATALAIGTGGTALVAYGVAAAAGAGAVDRLVRAQEQLSKSGRGRAFLENQEEINDLIKQNETEIQKLGASVGQVDFSNFKGAGDDITELSRRFSAQAGTIKQNIGALQALIKEEKAKEDADKNLIAAAEEKIIQEKKNLAIVERSANASSAFVTELLRQEDAATETAVSTEELAEATKKFIKEIDVETVNAQTEAIKEYGREANAAELLAAANIGIAAAATEKKIELYQREIQKLQQKEQVEGVLNEKDKKRQTELTALIAQESQKQAQLGIDARNAVIDAFEAGIDRVNQKVSVIGQSASALKGSFDGVTSSFVSGLQAAGGLIDAIVDREIQGLEVGSVKRKNIITQQLKAQASAIATESSLAKLKTQLQSRIAQSEARIAQIRLRTEAAVAKARGQEGLAAELNNAANVQGQIIEGLKMQEQIDLKVIELGRQKQEQGLIQKGQQEQLAGSAQDVADKIGVQVVSQKQATEEQKKLQKQLDNYSKKMSSLVDDTQNLKEETANTAFDQGSEESRKIADALDHAEGAAEGLNTVMNSVNGTFNAVAGTGDIIKRTLQDAITEANKLIRLTNTGGGPARALGGPVAGGQQYTVNDGGGREAFLSASGKFSMLPAARNIQWTAPSSGTIISAKVLKAMQRNQSHNGVISNARVDQSPTPQVMAATAMSSDSGSLAKQISSAMSGSTSNRITNNVTIQSQSPVNDASDLMTNVARMRLRNSRRI